MHIVQLVNERVPVAKYGGTERVVVWLTRALVEMGHRVTLIAPEGSTLAEATVVTLPHRELQRPDLDIARLLPSGADIVHAHRQMPDTLPVPLVWTLHGNYPPLTRLPPNTIYLSANHARRFGSTRYVYNGLDISEYRFQSQKGDYDLFLGRLHSVKGYKWAIAGARQAGRRLVLAGGWKPSLRRDISFAGRVGGERKAALLSGARCLWMPALWDEPFGLTLIEALASGTPVLGTHRGSLPEIVSSDVGVLGDSVEELVAGRAAIEAIEPEACRARVERLFTHRAMAENYLREYALAR
jgi:glycosyltransferase involved in cell wall biosynthesis